jgi:hypothetical protein
LDNYNEMKKMNFELSDASNKYQTFLAPTSKEYKQSKPKLQTNSKMKDDGMNADLPMLSLTQVTSQGGESTVQHEDAVQKVADYEEKLVVLHPDNAMSTPPNENSEHGLKTKKIIKAEDA